MRTEMEKMLAGEAYDTMDPELTAERAKARALCQQLNSLSSHAPDSEQLAILTELFGAPTKASVAPPFYCDYGINIQVGSNVFFNYNCVILDVGKVSIGDRVLFGPAVQVYTVSHPMSASRSTAQLYGKPVTIGDDVWLGGGVIICPGVTIGKGAVIGAGSVVTGDIPESVFAAGNPCRVIRKIDN